MGLRKIDGYGNFGAMDRPRSRVMLAFLSLRGRRLGLIWKGIGKGTGVDLTLRSLRGFA
jgi:hypothetical protein